MSAPDSPAFTGPHCARPSIGGHILNGRTCVYCGQVPRTARDRLTTLIGQLEQRIPEQRHRTLRLWGAR